MTSHRRVQPRHQRTLTAAGSASPNSWGQARRLATHVLGPESVDLAPVAPEWASRIVRTNGRRRAGWHADGRRKGWRSGLGSSQAPILEPRCAVRGCGVVRGGRDRPRVAGRWGRSQRVTANHDLDPETASATCEPSGTGDQGVGRVERDGQPRDDTGRHGARDQVDGVRDVNDGSPVTRPSPIVRARVGEAAAELRPRVVHDTGG